MHSLVKLFWTGCILIALLSCGSRQKTVESSSNRTVTRSVVETFRDTILKVPRQQTELGINVRQLCADYEGAKKSKPKTTSKTPTPDYSANNGDAFVKANILGDFLRINAGCDSLAIAAKIKETLIKETDETDTSNSQNIKRGVSTFRLIYTSAGALAIGLIAGIILTKFKII